MRTRHRAEQRPDGPALRALRRPPRWDRGHGGALLRRVHELLAVDGHAGAMLWLAAGNERSIGFYAHHGWVLDGATQREEVAGATFDEVRMVRPLVAQGSAD
ncbi:N-acetyltransferase family protein [Egicoccus sp. AB-alg6-2]|uniref:GNAT family N-acetyltransferase n=1 Tax=Egicoccus sp. AB-alg6-2 TaxID=3242692 RepID=UPI00359E1041